MDGSYHLRFPNGSSHLPRCIGGIRRISSTRFVLYNLDGDFLDGYEHIGEATPADNALVCDAYLRAIQTVLQSPRRWQQPDWEMLRETVLTAPSTPSPTRL